MIYPLGYREVGRGRLGRHIRNKRVRALSVVSSNDDMFLARRVEQGETATFALPSATLEDFHTIDEAILRTLNEGIQVFASPLPDLGRIATVNFMGVFRLVPPKEVTEAVPFAVECAADSDDMPLRKAAGYEWISLDEADELRETIKYGDVAGANTDLVDSLFALGLYLDQFTHLEE